MTYSRAVPPRRLYKYQPFTARTLTALKVRSIWFGRPADLNDPFDCALPIKVAEVSVDDCKRLVNMKDDENWSRLASDRRFISTDGEPTELLRRQIHASATAVFVRQAAELYWNRGVTCFSETPTDTLLWSHYGGGHRGICLEFDTTDPVLSRLHCVEYTDRIPVINAVDELVGDGAGVMRQILTKARCWEYEREWRAIHVEAGKEYCYGVKALTGVYLGAQLTDAEKDLVCHILYGSPTRLYEMTRTGESFTLEAQELNYTPYTYPEQ